MKLNIYLFLALITLYTSCVDDTNNPITDTNNHFTISMDKGPYANQTLIIKDSFNTDEIAFETTRSLTKLGALGIKEEGNNRLSSLSQINFSWIGATQAGNYKTISYADTISNQAGNLELLFLNGDEIITTIFKGESVNVTQYEAVNGRIKGSLTFQSAINGMSNNKPIYIQGATVKLTFDMIRGKDF